MNDQTVTPNWTLTRVSQVDGRNLSLTCEGKSEPALEITIEGKTTLNTPLTVNGALAVTQAVTASGGMQVSGGLAVTGPIEAAGGITGPGMLPKGAIIMWAGEPKDVPAGWALCDGSNGTPDMRGKFPVGADGIGFQRGEAGGAATHLHSVFHDFTLVSSRSADGKAFPVVVPETGQRLAFNTHEASSLPPYLPLHFIIKL